MPRIARVVLAETPYHVTQRGVDRQVVFFSDADRRVYLELVQHRAQRLQTRLLGYCLMSNHVYWIVIPSGRTLWPGAFGQAPLLRALRQRDAQPERAFLAEPLLLLLWRRLISGPPCIMSNGIRSGAW